METRDFDDVNRNLKSERSENAYRSGRIPALVCHGGRCRHESRARFLDLDTWRRGDETGRSLGLR